MVELISSDDPRCIERVRLIKEIRVTVKEYRIYPFIERTVRLWDRIHIKEQEAEHFGNK
jgi:hypothetical protein